MRSVLSVATLLTLLSGLPSDAAGQVLSLEIKDGLVTLDAQNVSVWQILQRWATVADVTFVDGEKIPSTPVTIMLTQVPETDALKTILRDVSGYIVGRRETPNTITAIDRVLILATSATPRPAPVTAPRGGRVAGIALPPQEQTEDDIVDAGGASPFSPEPAPVQVAPVRAPAPGSGVATFSSGRAAATQTRPGTVSTPAPTGPLLPGAPTGMVGDSGNPVMGPTVVPESGAGSPAPPSGEPTPNRPAVTGSTRPGTITPQ